MIHKPNFFVFTGGPSAGKTTLLRRLASRGERTVAKNARAVIRDELATGGAGAPWLDNDRFCRLTAARDIAVFEALAHEPGRVFFDRGLMDSFGANGAAPWPELIESVRKRRYNRRVFLFPPWREIYETDAERRQDWPEAERTYALILDRLPTLGYAPVIVPIGTMEERARFVLDVAASFA